MFVDGVDELLDRVEELWRRHGVPMRRMHRPADDAVVVDRAPLGDAQRALAEVIDDALPLEQPAHGGEDLRARGLGAVGPPARELTLALPRGDLVERRVAEDVLVDFGPPVAGDDVGSAAGDAAGLRPLAPIPGAAGELLVLELGAYALELARYFCGEGGSD